MIAREDGRASSKPMLASDPLRPRFLSMDLEQFSQYCVNIHFQLPNLLS